MLVCSKKRLLVVLLHTFSYNKTSNDLIKKVLFISLIKLTTTITTIKFSIILDALIPIKLKYKPAL